MSRPSQRPPSLAAQMQQQADAIHARRSAEIKRLAPLLAHFEEIVPALQQRGLQVYPDMLSRWSDLSEGGRNFGVLRIAYPMSMDNQQGAQRWLDALTELGFIVVRRSEAASTWPHATLRRGHLLVCIDVPRAPAAIAQLGMPLQRLAA